MGIPYVQLIPSLSLLKSCLGAQDYAFYLDLICTTSILAILVFTR